MKPSESARSDGGARAASGRTQRAGAKYDTRARAQLYRLPREGPSGAAPAAGRGRRRSADGRCPGGHARARRVLEKSAQTPVFPQAIYDEDRALIRKLSEYREIVEQAARGLEPHHICTYLFELAQEFNRYYEHHQVIGSDKEAHRIAIVALYADILKAGLAILGISAPDEM